LSPAEIERDAAAPTVPVAVKVTERLPDVAVTVLGPGVFPSVHDPTVAMPAASVTAEGFVSDPPPAVTAKVTVAPANGALFWSFTITEGAGVAVVPATADNEVDEFGAIVVGAGGGGGGGGGLVVPPSPLQPA